MKRMLMNTTSDEWRIALVEDNYLYDLDIELRGQEQITANIYKGRITRVEPSLEAAFIDYGGNRHGFLPLKEVAAEYLPKGQASTEAEIKASLTEGKEIILQVEKEERGTKGAAVTTYITLAGCYLVLMPNNPDAGGISRRIEGDERDELRTLLDSLQIPEGMGVIIRTAGVGKSLAELQWDLDALVNVWKAIKDSGDNGGKAPFLIHQEGDAVIRAVRDYLRADVEEIIVDEADVFARLKQYLARVRPEFAEKVTLHDNKDPLFTHYHIESQVETAFQREVRLPSGGAIVIDPTEALVAIDINSARSTKGGDIEETALHTNLEAADEVARQLRLRDMGGLVIIDFIDMLPSRNRRAVEKRLRDALSHDRARVQTGSISRFGLLEMSRQRLRTSLREARQMTCPRCHGQGTIRGTISLTSSLLRLIEEKAQQESTAQVRVQVPHNVATYIFNEKRQALADIERESSISVVVIANPHLESPAYEIEAVTVHEYATTAGSKLSYEMAQQPAVEVTIEPRAQHNASKAKTDKPRVSINVTDRPAPKGRKKQSGGFFQRLVKNLFGSEDEKPEEKKKTSTTRSNTRPRSNTRNGTSNNNRSRNNSRDGRSNSRREGNRNNTRTGSRNDTRTDNRSNNRNDTARTDNRSNNRNDTTRTDNRSNNRNNTRTGNRSGNRNDTRTENQDETPDVNGNRSDAPDTNRNETRDGNRSRTNNRRGPRGANNNRSRTNRRAPRERTTTESDANKPEASDINVSLDTSNATPSMANKPVNTPVNTVTEKPAKATPAIEKAVTKAPVKVEAKKPVKKKKPLPPPPASSLSAEGGMQQVETKNKED